jgi:ABC-type multidrug transport system fused ATPase/permease subunit
VLVEAVDGIEDLKAAGAQGRFLRQYEDATAAQATSQLKMRRLTALTMNVAAVAQQAVTLVLLVWGVYLIDAKLLTGGALIGAVMFSGRALAPLASVVQLATRYQGARAAMRALDHVMQQPVEREPGKVYVPKRELSGQLALIDAGFAYPAPPLRLAVVHADFYRLEDPRELAEIGLDDYREGAALLAEWPDHAGGFDREPGCLSFNLEFVGESGAGGRIAIARGGADWLGRMP